MALYGRKLSWAIARQKIGDNRPSGSLLSLFNEKDIPTFKVSYVYAIIIPESSLRGPYSHSMRTTACTILAGCVDIVYFDKPTGLYEKLSIMADDPVQVVIPPDTPFCLIGTSKSPAIVVNICDFPWSPDSKECTIPDFKCDYVDNLLKREPSHADQERS